jgi:hypothetical protein
MANDTDMWNDLMNISEKSEKYKLLFKCFHSRFIDFDEKFSTDLKEKFIRRYKFWGNYY